MKHYFRKKILMISYYFPPLLDVGCKRSVTFAKYLKKHGWEPHVLSVRNPDRHYCLLGTEQPPQDVPAEYTHSIFNLYWFIGKINGLISRLFKLANKKVKQDYAYDLLAVPDHFIGWVPGAVISGYRLIRNNGIDYIYVSCSPHSAALAGMLLKKLTGKPLIIDFRDPFYINIPGASCLPRFRRKLNRTFERAVIDAADLFIVNTDEVRKGYIREYPDIAGKTFSIHNGFDLEEAPAEKKDKYKKFTIAYGGNFYCILEHSQNFFQALALLKEKRVIDEHNFQFLYFGQNHDYVARIAKDLSIGDLVSAGTIIPHKEMLQVLMRSHLQLLRIVKPMISTKFFEGIPLDIPFLATIPDGEVAELIRKYSPSSRLVTESSPEMISNAIIAAMQDYRQGKIKDNHSASFLQRFARESLTSRLEFLIEKHVSTQNVSMRSLFN